MTDELAEFEKEIFSSRSKLEFLERELFKGIIEKVRSKTMCHQEFEPLFGNYRYLPIAFARPLQEEMVAPSFNLERDLNLKGAWHPLIKNQLEIILWPIIFIFSEDCYFGLITGPNTAGKQPL